MKKYLLMLLLGSTIIAQASTLGLSFNPLRFFALGTNQLLSVTGTLSYFNDEKSYEIAIPYFYQQDFENTNGDFGTNPQYVYNEPKLFITDLQYRRYFRKQSTQGLYYGALLRYTYLEGNPKYNKGSNNQHKFGLGMVTGFRIKTKIEDLEVYWGANISMGGYLNREVDLFGSDFSVIFGEDGRLFLDIELLKIGVEF